MRSGEESLTGVEAAPRQARLPSAGRLLPDQQTGTYGAAQ